jgi:aldose 1-epimerase
MSIDLHAGDLRLALDPGTGGAIASFTYRGTDLLRPVIDPRLAAQRGRPVAAYPLIPYANRIAWGRFAVDGQEFQLARNFGDHPHPIHGNAWMRPWSVAAAGKRHALLTLDNVPARDPTAEWPFAYHAEQHFALHDDSLAITLSVQNRDTRAWPAGLGLHPYVARTAEATLRFEADTVWTTGPDSLPRDREAVRGNWEFDETELLGAIEIDSCYAGWGGIAVVTMPEEGFAVVVAAGPPLDHLQVYTPAGRDYLGLEPVSNMPDAINLMETVSDHGLVVLPPGGTLKAVVTIGLRVAAD